MPTDSALYDILGVKKTDSCADIKKAFLKLARVHHPDKGGDPEKFKEIHRASEILTDENKRKMYDDFGVIPDENGGGQPGPGGMPGGFPFPFEVNINDFFGGMFGGNRQGNNVRKGRKPSPHVTNINATLEQFYMGYTYNININRQTFCKECNHSGAKTKETCSDCKGRGVVSQVHQMGPMVMHTNGPCHKCEGKGEKIIEKCEKCSGSGFLSDIRNLDIKLTPGIRAGEVFIFNEVCSEHPDFEKAGDFHVIIQENHEDPSFKIFKRVGDKFQNLETNIVISLAESLIGCTIRIDGHPGYDDGLYCKIPAGSFEGDKYCINGLGMPILGDIGKYGDLIVIIHVDIKPLERRLFSTQGRELLSPLFEDKIRVTETTSESSIFTDVYLVK